MNIYLLSAILLIPLWLSLLLSLGIKYGGVIMIILLIHHCLGMTRDFLRKRDL